MLPDLLTRLHWTSRDLSRALGCHPSLCSRWLTGERQCPPVVLAWLAKLVAAHEAVPPPANWRSHGGLKKALDRYHKKRRMEDTKNGRV
jgi:hypothetical protein